MHRLGGKHEQETTRQDQQPRRLSRSSKAARGAASDWRPLDVMGGSALILGELAAGQHGHGHQYSSVLTHHATLINNLLTHRTRDLHHWQIGLQEREQEYHWPT